MTTARSALGTPGRGIVSHPPLANPAMAAYPASMQNEGHQRRRGGPLVAATAFGLIAWLAGAGLAGARPPYSVVSWYDEFDGTVVDPERWGFDRGTGTDFGLVGWGNNELQYYTDRTTNARVADGLLEITARREALGGMDYTSARLTTRGRFSQAGGRFEIRAALPLGQGFWPAFWMLPADNAYGGWAASGEIDILEARGQHPTRIENTIHYGGPWPGNTLSGRAYTLPAGGTIADFHTYAVEWDLAPTPTLRWYVDDRLSWSTTEWWSTGAAYPAPFDRPFHLLVNLAVGGNYVGPPDGSTPFPASMKVDYVRVFDSAPADIVIDIASGSRTQFEEGMGRILRADSLTKAGAGTLVLDAANELAGPTRVAAGRLQLTDPRALAASPIFVAAGATLAAAGGPMVAPSVTLAGGRLEVASLDVSAAAIGRFSIEAGTLAGAPDLTVGTGGALILPAAAPAEIAVARLSVDERAGGGLIDLGTSRITVAGGGTSTFGLLGDLLAGRGDGGWQGTTGITSTVAAASSGTRTVGYRGNADGTTTVSFAAPGDVDLDGQVNLFDLVEVDTAGLYGTGLFSTWIQGDFTYDGIANVFDLIAVDGADVYSQGSYRTTFSSGVAAVPEPSAVALLWAWLAASGLVCSRKKPENRGLASRSATRYHAD